MKRLVQEHSPTAPLKPFVVQYWEGTILGSSTAVIEQTVLPSGYIDLVLHLSDARCEIKIAAGWQTSPVFSLVGFWTDPYIVQFKDRVETFGIRFKPEAMYFIFGVPAGEFINRYADLKDVLGESFISFCLQLEALKTVEQRIRLADEYLLNRLYKASNPTSYVQYAADLIRRQKGEISVESLSDRACISKRQLEREFKNKLGISPKAYMRINRLGKVLDYINTYPSISLAQLSYLNGYSDQTHFNKDFKSLTGELPSVYMLAKENFVLTSK
ncbi:AraC family transcriptional regulator [Rhodocytophaga rosea]|uniref:AraC family transcriptional regulator n=1 Tax=Rhodocytophaga rosea TaxID=2704465 RepID=A0A6C0GI35_9BACT|nr:helix-turn-helix domain-containing protein [Rhodocytophaga rosea]QHT67353.1 AraC family transcriptional regulator [Rhodocytophaga rosea]